MGLFPIQRLVSFVTTSPPEDQSLLNHSSLYFRLVLFCFYLLCFRFFCLFVFQLDTNWVIWEKRTSFKKIFLLHWTTSMKLHSEFQHSQSYVEKPCLKKQNKTNKHKRKPRLQAKATQRNHLKKKTKHIARCYCKPLFCLLYTSPSPPHRG